ncbi:unnamed protein product [Closterium sp. Naga37s-1]|nr:unnamed protein product [Closterium sp. Naga37s-1]
MYVPSSFICECGTGFLVVQAIDRNERVLTKNFRGMTLGAPYDSAWTSYKLALGEEVMLKFSRELARSRITVHTALAIPPHDRMDRGDHGQLVKAAPDERKFSHIRIQGGGAVWFGRVLVLFQFTGPDGDLIQRAFIKYYNEVEPPCPVTGCKRLLPTSGADEYAVIELESILCLAHIVPSFVDPQKSEGAEGPTPSTRTLPEVSKKDEAAAAVAESVYIAGRYLKFSRALSQSPWTVDDEQMGDGSVQDLIASHLLPLLQPLSHKFQAAGREDIDVRMLGSGRPFLLELKGARRVPTAEELGRIELEINEQERGKLADSRVCALMRQGEAEKQVSGRGMNVGGLLGGQEKEREGTLCMKVGVMCQLGLHREVDGMTQELQQKTPIRVLHRRSPLTRPRTIYSMQCHLVPSNPHVFLLHLTTQASHTVWCHMVLHGATRCPMVLRGAMRCHLVPSNPHVSLLHLTTQASHTVRCHMVPHGAIGCRQAT